MERIYTVLINGKLSVRDSAVKTYKTRERAEKENQRYVKGGWNVQICEYTLVNISKVEEATK
jgi:hypothetical protein